MYFLIATFFMIPKKMATLRWAFFVTAMLMLFTITFFLIATVFMVPNVMGTL